jgi:type VI secretion system protein ImpH
MSPSSSSDRSMTPHLLRLQQAPYLFDFFQAVRLLHASGRPVGHDFVPAEECVRFGVVTALNFPSSEIGQFSAGEPSEGRPTPPPTLTIQFTGLTGPQGVLPRHYTQLLLDQVRVKDFAYRDFLDMFHHRMVSLFYRAWRKYHFPIDFEQTTREHPDGEDPFTHLLHCLVGLGGKRLRKRLAFSDLTLLYYGAIFAQRPPNAVSLERLVEDYFGVPARVEQFCGAWLYLAEEDQTQMSAGDPRGGLNTQLGTTALVGDRVWSIENRFVVELGPLSYHQFERFSPAGAGRRALEDFIRMYVGLEYDVETRLVLKRDEVPCLQFDASQASAPRLGWNTWTYNQTPQRTISSFRSYSVTMKLTRYKPRPLGWRPLRCAAYSLMFSILSLPMS